MTDSAGRQSLDKPLLTVEQQIAHMKARGITFDLVSEVDAAEHLRTKCQFFRIYAYRKSFQKYVGGKRDGQYVNLDFGHLRALSNLDRKLCDTLLPMTLDAEQLHTTKRLRVFPGRDCEGGSAPVFLQPCYPLSLGGSTRDDYLPSSPSAASTQALGDIPTTSLNTCENALTLGNPRRFATVEGASPPSSASLACSIRRARI